MSEVKSSKKRKHAAVESSSSAPIASTSKSSGGISVSVSKDAQKNGLLPLFASTPAISLTEDTSFTLYRGGEGSSSSKGKEKERLVPSMLHGESSKLEWTSTNRLHGLTETGEPLPETDEMATECSASYALALYDPSTSSLSVINAPLHILSHIPKRLKALPSMISDAPSAGGNAAARAELGLSFGTKKSIKAIRAAERNKVDAGAADLQSLQDVMMQDLSKGLETLPEGVGGTPRKIGGLMNEEELEAAKTSELQQVVEAAKNTGRPVPDVGAILPEQVYKIIGEVILEKELEAINVSGMMKVSSDQKEEAIRMLPYKLSHWVNDRVKELVQNSPKDKKRKLRVLVWISGLMAIKNMGKQGIDPTKEMDLKKRFGGGMSGNVLPPACSASLLERFAETIRGSKNLTMSSTAETRILCHIFLVCLHYEGYSSLDINLLQSDLSLNPKKTSEIVKSLGCRILTPKGADTGKIIAKWQNEGKTSSIPTSSSSRKVKIASLKIPLEFPRERKMAAKR